MKTALNKSRVSGYFLSGIVPAKEYLLSNTEEL
jgi:hypothetical protein